jgi:catechol 2,3-dioxygenase-like lactoylglutathione lyase family enzyme
MFKRIAHVCLRVKNLDQSIDFYTRLGLQPVFRFTRQGRPFGIYLKLAESSFVEIFEEPVQSAENPSLAHFCLETDDLHALTLALRDAGIVFTEKKLGCDGTWQIWLHDPDGNAFEVHQCTPQSLQFAGGSVEADW